LYIKTLKNLKSFSKKTTVGLFLPWY